MRDRIIDKQVRGCEDDAGQDQTFHRRGPDKSDQRLSHADRRGEQFIDRAGKARHINAEAGVGGGFTK